MSLALAVLAAVFTGAADSPGSLALTHVRDTYGLLGPERPDNKLLPGDLLVLAFDIEGATLDDAGKLRYSIAMEATDADGKVLFKQAPRDLETKVAPGTKAVPASASLQVGLDLPAGEYKLKVTVKDLATGSSQTVTRSYQVLPKAFGLVRIRLTRDSDGELAAAAFAPGKAGFINFTAVGFGRDAAKKQPHLVVAMHVKDAQGQEVLKPLTGEVTADVPEKATSHPMQFALLLPDAGKYTIELTGTDKISGESAKVALPITVKKTK
jgi:hypothetical protein